jgi:biotin-(acetyl-CoA carboxylase) ligase
MKEQLDKEIQVVEILIEQLNRCLADCRKEKIDAILTDIQKCKLELNRLVSIKDSL